MISQRVGGIKNKLNPREELHLRDGLKKCLHSILRNNQRGRRKTKKECCHGNEM